MLFLNSLNPYIKWNASLLQCVKEKNHTKKRKMKNVHTFYSSSIPKRSSKHLGVRDTFQRWTCTPYWVNGSNKPFCKQFPTASNRIYIHRMCWTDTMIRFCRVSYFHLREMPIELLFFLSSAVWCNVTISFCATAVVYVLCNILWNWICYLLHRNCSNYAHEQHPMPLPWDVIYNFSFFSTKRQ